MNTEPRFDATEVVTPPAPWPGDADPVDPNFWTPPAPPYSFTEELPEPERPRRRWRLAPRSLTGRLVAGVVALVIVLVLATGLGTYFALRSFLLNRLDQ